HSSAQYGRNSSSANASSSRSASGSSGRTSDSVTPVTATVSEQVLKSDGDPGRQDAELREREQDAGHERIARDGVVADRQRLALAAEDDLLVRDEPRKADGVDRDVAFHRRCRRLGGARWGVDLRRVMELDDLRRL